MSPARASACCRTGQFPPSQKRVRVVGSLTNCPALPFQSIPRAIFDPGGWFVPLRFGWTGPLLLQRFVFLIASHYTRLLLRRAGDCGMWSRLCALWMTNLTFFYLIASDSISLPCVLLSILPLPFHSRFPASLCRAGVQSSLAVGKTRNSDGLHSFHWSPFSSVQSVWANLDNI